MKGLLRTMLAVAVVLGVASRVSYAETLPDLKSWMQELRQEAIRSGVSRALVDEALPDSFTPDERVVRLDRKQPEHHVTFERYKKNVITESRIKTGRRLLQENKALLDEISAAYGVEPEYIVALWGIETSFGRNMGGFEIIPSLATLAYEGRRGEFFRRELLKALHIVDRGHVGLHQMKGSWAGAMGQCQFMPSSFERFAQDYDRDGRRDIWGSKPDVFASIAAYLSGSGWKKGEPWGQLARLPAGFDPALMGRKVVKPVSFWREQGVRLAGSGTWPDGKVEASIVQPGGEGYKTYIIYGNYRVIMQWNTSIYFATAVGLFADQLK